MTDEKPTREAPKASTCSGRGRSRCEKCDGMGALPVHSTFESVICPVCRGLGVAP